MKKFYFAAVAVIAAAVAAVVFAIPEASAQSGNSQEFVKERFVLVAAQVNVFSPEMGAANDTQYVMVRMDTVTGRSWILQLDVAGGNAPKVRRSVWHELGFRQEQ